jgi:NAD(P)-dependent dehydrogenase (short-subunit alcohol dehydrogenase family)
MDIEGRSAIVTGANRGIGEAFVDELLAAGAARVYAGTRDPRGADALITRHGARCVPVTLDVTDADAVSAAAARGADVSIVINNAGAFTNQRLMGAPDMRGARLEMEVNYFGVLSMCRTFAPILAAHGGGAIVNVLSAAAIAVLPSMGGYPPSKAAARALSTAVRAELAPAGTQVTALIVGSVDTRMASHVQGAKEAPADIARAGIKAVRHAIDEMDTDRMAVEVRAAMALDPRGFEKRMARLLHATSIKTGR